MAGSQDKRFKPTPKRIEHAKSKGSVPRTRELGPALAFLAVATAAAAAGSTPWRRLFSDLDRRISATPWAHFDVEALWILLRDSVVAWGPLAATLLGAAAAGSLLGQILREVPSPPPRASPASSRACPEPSACSTPTRDT